MPIPPQTARRPENRTGAGEDLAAIVIGILGPLTRAAARDRDRPSGARAADPVDALVGDLATRLVGDTLEAFLSPSGDRRHRGSAWADAVDRPETHTDAQTAGPDTTAARDVVSIDLADPVLLTRLGALLDVDVDDLVAALRTVTTPTVDVEPADPSVRLTDRDGCTWARVEEDWVSSALPSRSFEALLGARGPLHITAGT